MVQLWVLKQFSPCDSPIATPAAVHSLTSASHFTVFLNAFPSDTVIIIILLWWHDAAASLHKTLVF